MAREGFGNGREARNLDNSVSGANDHGREGRHTTPFQTNNLLEWILLQGLLNECQGGALAAELSDGKEGSDEDVHQSQ